LSGAQGRDRIDVLPPGAKLESGQTVLIFLVMALVLAMGLSKWRNRREHFPSGEISFLYRLFSQDSFS
jgi:hypothetical protein